MVKGTLQSRISQLVLMPTPLAQSFKPYGAEARRVIVKEPYAPKRRRLVSRNISFSLSVRQDLLDVIRVDCLGAINLYFSKYCCGEGIFNPVGLDQLASTDSLAPFNHLKPAIFMTRNERNLRRIQLNGRLEGIMRDFRSRIYYGLRSYLHQKPRLLLFTRIFRAYVVLGPLRNIVVRYY